MFAPAPVSQPDALRLHQRLVEGDILASDALASAFLDSLVLWLHETNPSVDEHLITEAADNAVLGLIRRPHTYDPSRGTTLENYLRMSARGDLRNLLSREKRQRAGQVSLQSVELSDDGGNNCGRDDDPSLPLQIVETEAELREEVPPSVWESLSDVERAYLELKLQGERRTIRFAEACGFANRSADEQTRLVKQIGDRLTKRIERAKPDDEQEPGTTGQTSRH